MNLAQWWTLRRIRQADQTMANVRAKIDRALDTRDWGGPEGNAFYAQFEHYVGSMPEEEYDAMVRGLSVTAYQVVTRTRQRWLETHSGDTPADTPDETI
jgi:hypothetical protein